VIAGGRRKLHYLYPDNTEMVEEFDVNSNECLSKCQKTHFFLIFIFSVRKWKKPRQFGEAEWVFEIGQDQENTRFDPEK